jgi:hypothetical protein
VNVERELGRVPFPLHRPAPMTSGRVASTLEAFKKVVYVDNTENQCRGMLICHKVADTLEELHAMAVSDDDLH